MGFNGDILVVEEFLLEVSVSIILSEISCASMVLISEYCFQFIQLKDCVSTGHSRKTTQKLNCRNLETSFWFSNSYNQLLQTTAIHHHLFFKTFLYCYFHHIVYL